VGSRTKPFQYRLEAATGKWLPQNRMPPWTRPLTDTGLLDFGDRPGNTLGYWRDGALRWHVPASAAFPPGFSSDSGWAWHVFADQHVIVGSLYGPATRVGSSHSTRDVTYFVNLATTNATAGLSERTGEVLWRDRGSKFHCRVNDDNYPVRCRSRGVIKYWNSHTAFDDLDVTIEGFDPTTGNTTWSVPMGAAGAFAHGEAPVAIAGATQVVLPAPNGPVMLDYATGQVTPLMPGTTYWCMTRTYYQLPQSYRAGDKLAAVCDEKGQPATALPSIAATIGDGYLSLSSSGLCATLKNGSTRSVVFPGPRATTTIGQKYCRSRYFFSRSSITEKNGQMTVVTSRLGERSNAKEGNDPRCHSGLSVPMPFVSL